MGAALAIWLGFITLSSDEMSSCARWEARRSTDFDFLSSAGQATGLATRVFWPFALNDVVSRLLG